MRKKHLQLILAALMLGVLASCGDSRTQVSNETIPESEQAKIPESSEEDVKITNFEAAKEFVGETNLDGKTFRILSPDPGGHFYYWTSAEENEIYYDASADDVLSEAIYLRNLQTEEALGIKIEAVWGGNTGDINSTVANNVASGDNESYHVVLNRLDYILNQAMNGNYLNFYGIDTMNMKNPWWDEHIVDTFTIFGNRLYALSGDINYYDDYAVQAILFNKKMCDELVLEYPYDAVREGTWTMDKLVSMSQKASRDVDGDGVWVMGKDIFGFGDNYDIIPHMIFCYDLKMSNIDENGAPTVPEPDEKLISALEEIYNFAIDTNVVLSQTYESAAQFRNDRLLFYAEMIGSLPSFRDMESDFGVIPMPKGDESIDGYRAYVSNGWTTAFAVPASFTYEQAAEAGVVLEMMSAASADLVTPALYDQLFDAKYIRDRESQEMLEYVFDSKVYDWAGDLSWASGLRTNYTNVFSKGPASFTTTFASQKKANTRLLSNMCDKFAELPDGDPVVPESGVSLYK